ncbi:hypothetical protein AABB24_031722 [Solanum stoloniferum]|uniref:Reverse transcriptase zinc-binding domain-containing protein n=1 Tax=Solanum stoloniferum TaxID=62892 RepID=A0ABD2RUU2_9SOLN
MWNKYCKKVHPTVAKGQGSYVWRKMNAIREEIEHNIWWQVKEGNSSFWFDNWTKQGALYFIEGENAIEEEIEVKKFMLSGSWNEIKLLTKLSQKMTGYIMESIKPLIIENGSDRPWWMGNTQGSFTVKSAWHLLRQKKKCRRDYEFIWCKGLPFKVNFFLWNVWNRKIASDDNLKRIHIPIASGC